MVRTQTRVQARVYIAAASGGSFVRMSQFCHHQMFVDLSASRSRGYKDIFGGQMFQDPALRVLKPCGPGNLSPSSLKLKPERLYI